MGRAKHVEPKAHLHITLNPRLREQLDNAVWSNLEGRIPPAALQTFVESRLREHFSQVRLDLQPYLAVGGVISGMPETVEALKELLDRGQGPTPEKVKEGDLLHDRIHKDLENYRPVGPISTPKDPEASDQSAKFAPCGSADHWRYTNSGEDCLICLEVACEREKWKRGS